MPTLLVVQHTPSPAVQEMLEAVLRGTEHPEVKGVNVEVKAALSAGPADVLAADGIILGTPANIGYMSGALKHFLDQVYYPCLEVTVGLPYGVYVHGNDDRDRCLASPSLGAQLPQHGGREFDAADLNTSRSERKGDTSSADGKLQRWTGTCQPFEHINRRPDGGRIKHLGLIVVVRRRNCRVKPVVRHGGSLANGSATLTAFVVDRDRSSAP